MMALKCTRKLLDLLGGVTTDDPRSPTNALGDWYANRIPTVAGELIVFASERTLLSVAVPIKMMDVLLPAFVTRVYSLLVMIGVSEVIAARECAEMPPIALAKTSSRSILASMNDISHGYQAFAQRPIASGPPGLSEAELKMSERLHRPLDYVRPAELARRRLAERYGSAESYP